MCLDLTWIAQIYNRREVGKGRLKPEAPLAAYGGRALRTFAELLAGIRGLTTSRIPPGRAGPSRGRTFKSAPVRAIEKSCAAGRVRSP